MFDKDGDERDREAVEARPHPDDEAGEDEGSSAQEGDERHLKENQKNEVE